MTQMDLLWRERIRVVVVGQKIIVVGQKIIVVGQIRNKKSTVSDNNKRFFEGQI